LRGNSSINHGFSEGTFDSDQLRFWGVSEMGYATENVAFFGEYDDNHDEAANLGKKCPKFSDQTMRSTLAVQQSRKVALFWKIG